MLKKWFLLLLACLTIFTLSACNKEEPTPPSNDDPTPSKPTTPPAQNAEVLAHSGTLQNGAITWEIYTTDGTDGVLYLKGSGALEDFENAKDQPWWTYGDDTMYGERNMMEENIALVTEIVVGEGITALGGNAFAEQLSVSKVTLPSTLTALSDSCFKNCPKLRTVSGGMGLVTIAESAFKYCTVLESIELSSELREVGWCAFDQLQKPLTVRFDGTEAQWSAITVDSGNDALKNATVVYPAE
jgi:hypothetical protein